MIVKRLLARSLRRRVECLFVLSTGRCGTMGLTSLLDLSPRIDAVHEPSPLFLEETMAAYMGHPVDQARSEAYAEDYAAGRSPMLAWAAIRGVRFAECSNRMTYFAPFLAEYFPRSRFLHLYRHPGDVVRSAMRRGHYDHHRWDPYRITPRPDDPFADAWEHWGPFEKCCWNWQAINQHILDFRAAIDPRRVAAVSFESLFRSDQDKAMGLFDWLGVPRPSREDVRRSLETRENAQQEGEFPAWRAWTDSQKSRLSEIAGSVAERLGYADCLEPARKA
jgi:hypothetical protein